MRDISIKQMEDEMHAAQTHCFTCGGKLPAIKQRVKCPTCGEWQCSQKCCDEHCADLDNV